MFAVAHVGDTLHRVGEKVDAVAGLQLMKPTACRTQCAPPFVTECLQVYAGIYPVDANDFLNLEESIRRVRN
jgi:translation elongation factor EF-4